MARKALTLVIVDGHDGVRAALAERLKRLPGVQVLAVIGEVHGAVQLIEDLVPDAVLLDPKTVTGDPVVSICRLVGIGPPIVILTASLVSGEAATFMDAGAAAVLVKDIDVPGLLRSIEAAIAARHSLNVDQPR